MDGSDLVVVRRMMALAEQAELRRKNPYAATKSLKEIVADEEETAGKGQITQPAASVKPQSDTTEIHLRDLYARLDQASAQSAPEADTPQTGTQTLTYSRTRLQAELEVTCRALEPVEGLVKRSASLAETDRYRFEFADPTTFKITDKWTQRATTVWGDPHVDTDDQEGSYNGEFSDLKESNTHTTLQLLDGTRVTFTAPDTGLIQAVDIYKGSQHLAGVGGGAVEAAPEQRLFAGEVDGASPAAVPQGDVVQAGGDGNDWYDPAGRLIWGQTTGPVVNTRPDYVVEMSYRQSITQETGVATINQAG